MNTFISMVTGAVLGFATSATSPVDGREDLVRNVLLGIAGAFVGIQLATMLLDSPDRGITVFATIGASIFGAIFLLMVVNKLRKT